MFENRFPGCLRSLNKMQYDYRDGEGIDFEPYRKFLSSQKADDWLKRWTGNLSVNANDYRVFGQDGTGGLAAIWTVRTGRPLLEQPIVFFGSEGELGVIASSFNDYLWLLAQGIGPYEAVAYGASRSRECKDFKDFAQRYAPEEKRPAQEILEAAKREFPEFEANIGSLCR